MFVYFFHQLNIVYSKKIKHEGSKKTERESVREKSKSWSVEFALNFTNLFARRELAIVFVMS